MNLDATLAILAALAVFVLIAGCIAMIVLGIARVARYKPGAFVGLLVLLAILGLAQPALPSSLSNVVVFLSAIYGLVGFFVAFGLASRSICHRPPAPRSTALSTPAQRAVWDPATVGHYGHEAVTQALRPIWLAKRPYDFNEAELAAWSELASAFDADYKQREFS